MARQLTDAETAAKFRQWREKPSTMVRELFGVKPDPWQEDVLDAFPHKQRIALLASKGVGKTACLAWLAWNFLLTRPTPKLAATSISGDNLRDNFWTEMARWRSGCPLLEHLFEWTSKRIFARENPEQWWLSARTWPQSGDATQQAETLAGLHADYIFFLIDESGGMSDAIMGSAEAALSSCVEGHIIQAGNPTQLGGPLYRAYKNEQGLWYVVPINGDPDNPKRSPRVSLEWARAQIAEYGREHPFVKVNVLGEFPPSSFNTLIGPDEVRAAMKRFYREFQIGPAPKIIGVDVARYGDDSTIITQRQGIQVYPFLSFRNLNGPEVAGQIMRRWNEWQADAVFVDDTGGFGGSAIDHMSLMGRRPVGVHFNAKAYDKQRFENKRAEMYFQMVEWIRAGGALPHDEDLLNDLVNTTYTAPKGALILEPKAMVKAKQAGRSPDKADSLALTFAEPVTAGVKAAGRGVHTFDFDPFPVDTAKASAYDFDPFGG